MPFDEHLAERIRDIIGNKRGMNEKRMFGGIGFLLDGNLCGGVMGENLIVRVGKENYERALARDHVREFNVTGRSMTGWVLVDPDGTDTSDQLESWLNEAVEFTSTLPPK